MSTNATAFFISSFIFFRFINHLVFVCVASLPVMVVMFSLDTIVLSCSPFSFPFPESQPPHITLSRVRGGDLMSELNQ